MAERYGYINRALPPDELGPFVEQLAYRIAGFSPEAIALAKASVNCADLPTMEGLLEEAHFFDLAVATQAARKRLRKFLELGGQTRDVELDLRPLADQLAE